MRILIIIIHVAQKWVGLLFTSQPHTLKIFSRILQSFSQDITKLISIVSLQTHN